MPRIPTIRLSSGQNIPAIGLGFRGVPQNITTEIAYLGLKQGYRLLDTAQGYSNEREVVEGIVRWIEEDPEHNRREDVVYTTKVQYSNQGYEKAKESIVESLTKAQELEYIDVLLVDQPHWDKRKRLTTYSALEDFAEAGLVKSIGVSNYGVEPMRELLEWPELRIVPAVNQLELYPGFLRQETVDLCRANNILPEACSPLMHASKLDDSHLVELGRKYGKTPSQILLRWSIQLGFVPVPKSTQVERMPEDLDVFDFELTKEEVQQLSEWE